ncbi:virulence-associated E family protein [Limosilactobacillus coleohominis DSM 14060]|nr:virulence-associated E family protein [Limosilactobacillus coleohominis DSM 14060]
MHVSKSRQKYHPVTDLKPEYVQQLWGEAMYLYKDTKFSFGLTDTEEEALNEHRKSFMYTDELEDKIDEALSNVFAGRKFITNDELNLEVAAGIDLVKNRKVANQISNIMVNRFGFRKKQKKIHGAVKRGYEKR